MFASPSVRWNETSFDVNKQCKDEVRRALIERLLRGEDVPVRDDEAAAAVASDPEEGEV